MLSKLNEIERINKEIINERDALVKEVTITKQNCKDSGTRIEDLNDENEKMNENYRNLRDNYIKLKNEIFTNQLLMGYLKKELYNKCATNKIKDLLRKLNGIKENFFEKNYSTIFYGDTMIWNYFIKVNFISNS